MTKQEQITQANHTQPPIVVDIYCRVSTEEQEDNTSLLKTQMPDCRQYAKDHSFIIGMEHKEVYSGFKYRERELLELMRKRYREGIIHGVIIRTFDRLSRSQVHFAILVEEMEHYGVELYCVKEQLDDTPIGRFTRTVLSFIAEMEREKILDRTANGRLNKAKDGKIVAGVKPPYGWKWKLNEKGGKEHIILNDEQVKTIRWIAECYNRGDTCKSIVKRLIDDKVPSPSGDSDKWSDRAVMRILTDIRITGKHAQQFTRRTKGVENPLETVDMPDGTYPAIISEELFERIQRRTAANKEEASRNAQNPEYYLLRAGFVKCQCGNAMVGVELKRPGKPNWAPRYVYQCRCSVNISSNVHRVPSLKLDGIVWQWLQQLADHVALIERAIELATNANTIESDTKAIEASLKKWKQKAQNYQEDLDDDTLRGDTRASVRHSLNHANQMIEQLETERAQVMLGMIDREREKAAFQEILEWCKKAKEAREKLTYQRKRDFLRLIGVVVIVKRVNLK
jgi:site-specific DNA recombinase